MSKQTPKTVKPARTAKRSTETPIEAFRRGISQAEYVTRQPKRELFLAESRAKERTARRTRIAEATTPDAIQQGMTPAEYEAWNRQPRVCSIKPAVEGSFRLVHAKRRTNLDSLKYTPPVDSPLQQKMALLRSVELHKSRLVEAQSERSSQPYDSSGFPKRNAHPEKFVADAGGEFLSSILDGIEALHGLASTFAQSQQHVGVNERQAVLKQLIAARRARNSEAGDEQ